jgi:hypothetical protein
VFDDLDVVHAEGVAVADELDRFEGPIADVDAPGESRISHDVSSCRPPPGDAIPAWVPGGEMQVVGGA